MSKGQRLTTRRGFLLDYSLLTGPHKPIFSSAAISYFITFVLLVQKTANGANSLNYEYNNISDDENTELKFKKLSENATTPLRASRNAAGKVTKSTVGIAVVDLNTSTISTLPFLEKQWH